jgi:hypothetical protein
MTRTIWFAIATLVAILLLGGESPAAAGCSTLAQARADHPGMHMYYRLVDGRKCWHPPVSERKRVPDPPKVRPTADPPKREPVVLPAITPIRQDPPNRSAPTQAHAKRVAGVATPLPARPPVSPSIAEAHAFFHGYITGTLDEDSLRRAVLRERWERMRWGTGEDMKE